LEYSVSAGLPDTRGATFMRPLGYMERLFHLYAREHRRHFCVAAEISGDIDVLDFQAAFDKVQQRHPMLPAYMAADARLGPSIYYSDRKLPVAVITTAAPEDSYAPATALKILRALSAPTFWANMS
jgi:hypothetical protein